MAISVSVMVLPESEEQAAKVVDALSRVACGLAFDGQTVSITINHYIPDEEERE